MRIVFMGTPDFAVTALDALHAAGHQIAGVFTRPDAPKNRGMKLTSTPVKQRALTLGIEVFQPKSMRSKSALEAFRSLAPDIAVVAAYGLILPQAALDIPPLGCINIHASLLPKYRGASPINTAIMSGERESGVTIMRMDAGLDTGDMLMAQGCEISDDETAGGLHDKLAAMGGQLIVRALAEIERGTEMYIPQPNCGSYAKMLTGADCAVDFSEAFSAANRIRGLDPAPGAFAELEGVKYKLFGAKGIDFDSRNTAGVIESCDKNGAVITCGRGKILVRDIQPPGKKRMEFAAFLRGRPALLGAQFDPRGDARKK